MGTEKVIHIEERRYTTQCVGEIKGEIVDLLKLEVESKKIIIYPGSIQHIKRKHQHAFKSYFHRIPDIINNPDYVGISGNGAIRLEFVKKFKDSILVAIKYDDHNNLFVSSMYIIEDTTIDKRVAYGRLIEIPMQGIPVKEKKQKYRNSRR